MKKLHLLFILAIITILFISCIKDNQAPTCTITNPNNGDEIGLGNTVVIKVDADDTDGNVTEVNFFVDEINIGSSAKQPFKYSWNTEEEKAGNHSIKVTSKDNNGGSTIHEIMIELIGLAPEASFACNKTTILAGEAVNFTDKSSNMPTSWEWNFGDGETSIEQNPNHIYEKVGNYTVCLTVTNDFGADTETKNDYLNIETRVSDYDGNTYKTVTIGKQEWMAENLKVTHYSDGNEIRLVTDYETWAALEDNNADDAFCYYKNNINGGHGALYTYAAAKNACPSGWHLPTDDEWKTLEIYLGMSLNDVDSIGWRGSNEGAKLKATNGWENNGNGTDNYGFAALPGSYRSTNYGTFGVAGRGGFWWSDTEFDNTSAWTRYIYSGLSTIDRGNIIKSQGLSIRCIKN